RTEVVAPEGILHGHFDGSTFRESVKKTVSFLTGFARNADVVVGSEYKLGTILSNDVRGHKILIADGQTDVLHAVQLLVCQIFGAGSFPHSHDGEFAAKDGLIKLEGFFSISVKVQIGVKFHGTSGFACG